MSQPAPIHWYDRSARNPIAAHARVRHAQRLLETTDLAVEQVAAEAGFGSAAVLREHFGTVVGTSPLSYRRAFSRVARSA
ncbi:MAG TPA: helix-turn-helix domain-containing protein [Vicinamibacterales bacterium]|nr:helix-turn-helix domain-containing protein [Vicinamibacterales bacterium]